MYLTPMIKLHIYTAVFKVPFSGYQMIHLSILVIVLDLELRVQKGDYGTQPPLFRLCRIEPVGGSAIQEHRNLPEAILDNISNLFQKKGQT